MDWPEALVKMWNSPVCVQKKEPKKINLVQKNYYIIEEGGKKRLLSQEETRQVIEEVGGTELLDEQE